jgi:head-tail adaptor
MTAPRLTRPLQLEAVQNIADGAGGYAQSWVSLGTVWAEVLAGTGREVAGEGVVISTTTYRITVRAAAMGSPARPKPDQRLRDGSRIFAILSVADRDADACYLICTAREEVPA